MRKPLASALLAAALALTPAAASTVWTSGAHAVSAAAFTVMVPADANVVDTFEITANLDAGARADLTVQIGGVVRTAGIGAKRHMGSYYAWTVQAQPDDAGKVMTATVIGQDVGSASTYTQTASATLQLKSVNHNNLSLNEASWQVGGTASVRESAAPAAAGVVYEWNSVPATVQRTGVSVTIPAEWGGKKVQVTARSTTPGWAEAPTTRTSVYDVSLGRITGGSFITGSGKVGEALRVSHSWCCTGVSPSYEWFAMPGNEVLGTGATYTPRQADIGKAVNVRVSATLAGYAPYGPTQSASPSITIIAGDPGSGDPGTSTPSVPGAGTGGTAKPSKVTASAPVKVKSGKKITVTLNNLAKGTKVKVKASHLKKPVNAKASKAGTLKVNVAAVKLTKKQKTKKVKLTVTAGVFKKTLSVKVVR